MPKHTRFENFKQNLINDNEKRYGDEIRDKYGNDVFESSNAKIKGMSKDQYAEVEKLSQEVNGTLKAAFERGDPSSELAQKVCELHKRWLCCFWNNYSKEAHIGVTEMYVDDLRFTEYYDKIVPGCAVFLRDAVKIFCRRQEKDEIHIQKFTKYSVNLESKTTAIAILADEIWREHYTPIIGEAQVDYMLKRFQSAEQICEDIKSNDYIYFTAEHIKSGEMIGYCACQPKKDYLLLSKIYIRKDYRGKGIAHSFLDEVSTLCREYGFDKIRLTVNKHNANSIAAYHKMGFETIDSIETDIGNGFIMDDFVMELAIK